MGSWGFERRGIVCIFFLVLCGFAGAKDYEVGETYKVNVEDLRPTQFAVGFKEIEIRERNIREAIAEGTLKELSQEKAGRAVIGPNGNLYLIDGHHYATALLRVGEKKCYVKIEKDYSNKSWAEFWDKMREKAYCHLYDENGEPEQVKNLPKTVRGLKDDHYRALAWLVRKCGGYEAEEMPFQEFHWANFFRTRIHFTGEGYESWSSALTQAMRLAASKAASELPGYTGNSGDCKKMLKLLAELERT